MISLSFFKMIITILHLHFCHKNRKDHVGFLETLVSFSFLLPCLPVPSFFSLSETPLQVCLHQHVFTTIRPHSISNTVFYLCTFSPFFLKCFQILFLSSQKLNFLFSLKICTRRLYEKKIVYRYSKYFRNIRC